MKTPRIRIALLAIALLALALSAPANAVSVVVDGRQMSFDQPPVMREGRVLVPLRGIFEGLGAQVDYQPSQRAIHATRGGTSVDLTLGSQTALVNGAQVYLDVPASTIGGRTLVPLRFVSEALGADVKWMSATQTVTISDGGTAANLPVAQPQISQRVQPAISDVFVVGNRSVYRPGDTMRVVMRGTPNGRATFDVGRYRRGIAMQEVSNGRYEGSCYFDRPSPRQRVPVVGHLSLDGLTAEATAATAVSVRYKTPGYPPQVLYPGPFPTYPRDQMFVNVTSPGAGQHVDRSFTVSGQTLPYAHVLVTASLQQSLIPGIVTLGTQRTSASGIADAGGYFHIPVTLDPNVLSQIVKTPDNDISLQVVATDPSGRLSRQVEFDIATSP